VKRLETGETGLMHDAVPRLAEIFDVSESYLLGLEGRAPRTSDAAFYVGKSGDPFEGAQLGQHKTLWRALSDNLSAIGIVTNDILVVDTSPAAIDNLWTGDAVVIAVGEVAHDAESSGPGLRAQEVTLIRQFVWPNLFITNSVGNNEPTVDKRRESVRIIGHIANRVAPVSPRQ